MPYIKKENRYELNRSIDDLAFLLNLCGDNDQLCGELNYVIFRITKQLLRKKISYSKINAITGALECCKQEIYRRIAAPYEEEKIEENGDVIL